MLEQLARWMRGEEDENLELLLVLDPPIDRDDGRLAPTESQEETDEFASVADGQTYGETRR